jgi:hypothetical protein
MDPGAVERGGAPRFARDEHGESARATSAGSVRTGILSPVKRTTIGTVVSLAAVATTVVTGWRLVDAGAAASKDYLATMEVTAVPAGALTPGGRAAVVLRITNAGSQDVVVHEVAGNGTITSDKRTCNVASVTFTGRSDLAILVPRKSGKNPGTADVTLPGAAAMSKSANDACQDATFTIPVRLGGDPV